MKIIDLLNKIANGEIANGTILCVNGDFYYNLIVIDEKLYVINLMAKQLQLLESEYIGRFIKDNIELTLLNDKVEIIEEDKKIEFENIEEFKEYKLINTKDILELEMIINKINAEYNYKINVLIQNQKKLIDVINNLKGSDD